MLVLIYDDFRADNEAHRAPGAPLPRRRRGRRRCDVTEANPTVIRMRSQQLDELVNVVSVGRGPVSRAVKAGVKALTPSELRSAGDAR